MKNSKKKETGNCKHRNLASPVINVSWNVNVGEVPQMCIQTCIRCLQCDALFDGFCIATERRKS